MNTKKVLEILEKAQAKGAAIEIKIDKKTKHDISLVQKLIDASNLDKAEEVLNELEKKAEEKMMGAIWEKRGWVADSRDKWDEEIKYFKKAKAIYEKIPGAVEFEGHPEDRILTVDHFTARALYFRGRKSDLIGCEMLFNKALDGYKKLKRNDAIAFSYSWLARVAIWKKDLKMAEDNTKKAEEFFKKTIKAKGASINTYIYRLKAELANSKGDKENAIRYSTEALRYTLPAGTYYNGVIEAVKEIVKASNS